MEEFVDTLEVHSPRMLAPLEIAVDEHMNFLVCKLDHKNHVQKEI